MRYLLGILCVCALGVMPLVGCSETAGTGGSGGTAGTGGDGGAQGVAPACDNADDLAAIAAGEPDMTLSQACVTANLPPALEADCATNVAACLLDGNSGAPTPTTLSAECTDCTAAQACCITHQCSILVGGTCSLPPNDDACEACIAEKCTPVYESCGEGAGGSGGSAGSGGAAGTEAGTLWLGGNPASNTDGTPFDTGWAICFYVNEDGTALTPSTDCDIDGDDDEAYLLEISWKDDVGEDFGGEVGDCSSWGQDSEKDSAGFGESSGPVPIEDNSFAVGFQSLGVPILAGEIKGTFKGDTATGTANWDFSPGMSFGWCALHGGWTASPAQ